NSRSKPIASQVKACDVNSNSSEIAKLTHAVNQQTNAVTTTMMAILKQFQATPPPALVKAVEETCVTCGEVESDIGNVYDDHFDSKGEKIKESKLLIDEHDLPCDFLPPFEYDSFISEDFSKVDDLPLTNNEDKIFNPDPGKFLIPCGFSELKCKALANLGASINLMPLSVWKKLGLPELIPTHMTFKLVNRAICTPAGIARYVFIPVGKFTFPADFVIVYYESDPRVPLFWEDLSYGLRML
nr:reverse transcriptase domain-containing protein [Tanacetum cinerariifolium]